MNRTFIRDPNYRSFRNYLTQLRPQVLRHVNLVEALFRQGAKPNEIAPNPEWPFSGLNWTAFHQNTYKLLGVKRITGAPYATHPTRMALSLRYVLGEQSERAIFYAIFHDYLEEGDGRNPEAVDRFRCDYLDSDLALVAAITLSEPMIDYDQFEAPRKELEDVAYVVQVLDTFERLPDRALIDASLSDKLDNIHHLAYITRGYKNNPEYRKQRLINKLGYFAFVRDHLGPLADQRLAHLLAEAVGIQSQRLKVPMVQIERSAQKLDDIFTEHRLRLVREIYRYQSWMGLVLTKR